MLVKMMFANAFERFCCYIPNSLRFECLPGRYEAMTLLVLVEYIKIYKVL